MNDKPADSTSGDTVSAPSHEPIEGWQVALISLPGAGKRTFLTRLYGANTGRPEDHAGRDYAIAFPPTDDPAETGLRTRYQERWEWICSHFEQKQDRSDPTDLSFEITGPGLPGKRPVRIRDYPPETFELPENLHAGSVAPDTLEQYQNACRRKHRHLDGAVILIDSAQAGDPESAARVKSILDFLPKRNAHRKPLFKVVVFTKAATGTGVNQRHDVIRQLETQWRKQGQPWVRVIACEAIRDLRKTTGSDGRVHGTLPQADRSGNTDGMPEWIHTPSSAILELARLSLVFKQHRRRLAKTAAGIALLVLAGLWAAHGYRTDARAFQAALDAPPDQQAVVLEGYITQSGARMRNLFYPFRHRTEPAIEQWNTSYFNEYLDHLDLETRIAELDDLRNRAIWQHLERAGYERAVAGTLAAIRDQNHNFRHVINDWKHDVYDADNPDSVIESRTFVFRRMPSMIDRAEAWRRELSADYASARREFEAFHALTGAWREDMDSLIPHLETMARQPPLAYRVLREQRAATLQDLAHALVSVDSEDTSYRFKRLLNAVDSVMRAHLEAPDAVQPRLRVLRDTINDRHTERRQQGASLKVKFLEAVSWTAKQGYCDQALAVLKDLPEAGEWRQRQTLWNETLRIAEQRYADMTAREQAARETPDIQLAMVREFAGADDPQLAPEHQWLAEKRAADLETRIAALHNAWETVEAAYHEFSDDPVHLPRLEKALAAYDRVLFAQNRRRIQEHDGPLTEIRQQAAAERERVAGLLTAYRRLKPEMRHQEATRRKTARRELAGILQQLDTSYERENNRQRIDDWLSNIRGCVDAISEPVSSDAEFAEALDALQLLLETADPFATADEDTQWARAKTDIVQAEWAAKHWNKTRRNAELAAHQQRFPEAVNILRDYRERAETPYPRFIHKAESATDQMAGAWRRFLDNKRRELLDTPFEQRQDYSRRVAKIEQWVGEYRAVMATPEALTATLQQTGDALNQQLLAWHTARIDTRLESLPEYAGDRRILTTWEHIETLRDMLGEIAEDPVVATVDPSVSERARRAMDRLNRTAQRRVFTLAYDALRLTVPNDGAYWTRDKFPRPTLHLHVNEAPLWRLDVEQPQDAEVLDSKGRTRRYRMAEKPGENHYVLTADPWTTQPDIIRYEKNHAVTVTVRIARQTGEPLRLHLIPASKTPGYLLHQTQHATTDDVTYRPIMRRARTMRLTIETTVAAEGLDDFAVPSRFENW